MKYLIYFLLVPSILACSKKDEVEPIVPDPPVLTNLLRTVIRNGLIFQEHDYYDDDRVKQSRRYTEGVLMEIYDLEYIDDTIVLRVVDNSNLLLQTHKMYYVNESISRREVYGGVNEEFAFYLDYIYASNDCGRIRTNYTSMLGSSPFTYNITEYTDQNCSRIVTDYNSEDVFQSKVEIMNDDMNSPYNSVSILDFYRVDFRRNNIEWMDYNANNELIDVWSYNASFEYNSIGYAISEARVYLDGSEVTYQYSYYSK